MMHDMSGARIVGLPVFGRRLWPEVIEAIRGKVREKVEDLGDHPGVDERILLVDVTRVSAIGVASLEDQLYDELEFLRMGGIIPVDNVYMSHFKDTEDLARGTDVARVWPR